MPAGVRVMMSDGLLKSQMAKSAGMEDLLNSLDKLLFLAHRTGLDTRGTFDAKEVQLEPGDRMVFGTDGITGASKQGR